MKLPFASLLPKWARRRDSLRTQLIAWNIGALALLLGLLGLTIRYTVRTLLMDSVKHALETQAQHLPPAPRPFAPHDMGGPGGPDFAPSGGFFAGPNGFGGHGGPPPGDFPGSHGPRPPQNENPYRAHHFDLQGRPLMPSDKRPMWDPQGFALAKLGETNFGTVVFNDEPLQVLSVPVREHGQVVSVAQMAYSLTDVQMAISGLDSALLMLIPVGLMCAGLGGAYLTDRVLRRVRRTAQAAEQISAHDFAARLPVIGSDEFSELAETFNRLLYRLETTFHQQKRLLEQQRRFTADASHELKTPLTIIKGTTSLAMRGPLANTSLGFSLQDIDQAADTMSQLVQDLLLLARSDSGQLGRNPIELLGAKSSKERDAASRIAAAPPSKSASKRRCSASSETRRNCCGSSRTCWKMPCAIRLPTARFASPRRSRARTRW